VKRNGKISTARDGSASCVTRIHFGPEVPFFDTYTGGAPVGGDEVDFWLDMGDREGWEGARLTAGVNGGAKLVQRAA